MRRRGWSCPPHAERRWCRSRPPATSSPFALSFLRCTRIATRVPWGAWSAPPVWTDTGVVPDSSGYATIRIDTFPQPNECLFVGSTTIVNGVETGSMTGYARVDIDCIDNDGDGYTSCTGDCDDHNPAIHPGAVEVCNGKDDDCDGEIDEGLDMDQDGVTDCLDNCPA